MIRDRIVQTVEECGLPEHMIPGILDYFLRRTRPGSFLYAVLCNDLYLAGMRADRENAKRLKNWSKFLSCIPMNTWGSKEIVEGWLNGCLEELSEEY